MFLNYAIITNTLIFTMENDSIESKKFVKYFPFSKKQKKKKNARWLSKQD